jgi:hypothetical protein
MSDKKSNVKVMKPGKGDAISVRHLSPTQKDREQDRKAFREHKENQQKIKEERFAAIQKRRKNRPSSGGSGGKINVKVTSEK